MRMVLALVTASLMGISACASRADGEPVAPFDPGSGGSLAVGENIVRQKCAGCHAVDRVGDSPMKAAPPFRTMGRTYPVRDLQEALAEGLVTAHPAMPPIELEAEEVVSVIAWLESVSGTGGGGPN